MDSSLACSPRAPLGGFGRARNSGGWLSGRRKEVLGTQRFSRFLRFSFRDPLPGFYSSLPLLAGSIYLLVCLKAAGGGRQRRFLKQTTNALKEAHATQFFSCCFRDDLSRAGGRERWIPRTHAREHK